MAEHEDRIGLEETAELSTIGGDPIEVSIASVSVGATVTASVVVDWQTWNRALGDGIFHLDRTEEPPSFEPGGDVELTLSLRPAFAGGVPVDADGWREAFAAPSSPIGHTEAWFATELYQDLEFPESLADELGDDAFTSVGDTTEWADYGADSDAFGDETDRVLDIVTNFLEADEWPYEVVDEAFRFVRTGVELDDDRRWSIVIHVDEIERRCTVYSIHPTLVPPDRRAAVARDLLTHSYEYDRGGFEMDPSDGEVSFRVGVVPAAESFSEAFGLNLAAMEAAYDVIDGRGDRPSA